MIHAVLILFNIDGEVTAGLAVMEDGRWWMGVTVHPSILYIPHLKLSHTQDRHMAAVDSRARNEPSRTRPFLRAFS